MVEYAYRDLFYKSQQTKDILIVDTEAVVTINPGGAPMVENATVEIHTADLKINTFTLDESLCSEEDLTWGLMESAEVRFTIKNTRRIPNLKSTDYSKMVNIYIYFNNDSSTLFQIGQYICDSDKYSSDRRFRDIVLYDALYYLRSWDITEWYNEIYADNDNDPISVYDLRFSLFDYMFTDFDYPIEQNEETELVNDDYLVPKNIESDTITFDFFMGGILNANGVFGHMGRTGLFEYVTLVKYDAPTATTVTDDFRKPPTTYEDFAVWGIGYVRVYDQNNLLLAEQGSSSYRRPSIYNIVDNFVLSGIKSLTDGDENIRQATLNIREQVTHRRYAPMDVEHVGDLCVEVGDNVAVTGDIGNYNTYVLERHLKGLGTMLDRYISRGNRKQPKYKINDNWHIGDSQNNSTEGYGGVSEVPADDKIKFIKYCKNIGIQFLYEPTVNLEYVRNSESHQVEIKWTDPPDLTTYRPHPVEWAGTIVVRSEKAIPDHPWDDCEILVDSTVRDAYSQTAYVDDTIEENKKYYYGIFPYYIMLDDADHPKKCYRFTKVYSVNTQRLSLAPLIVSHTVSGSDVTLTIEIPVLADGSYSYVKAVAKKNSIPASKTDGTVIDISASATSVTFSGLDEQSHYYFVIFANDGSSDIASDPDDCTTGRNEGYNFAYTGSIQTFTAPKTGIYQLETWGAQGGNAEDSENNLVARGGYGAYAKGEVLLVQGEKLYIGVGGQDGGNGGGGYQPLRCLNQIVLNGQTVNLMTLKDVTEINTALSDNEATRYNEQKLTNGLSHIQSLGDVFFDFSTQDFTQKEWVIKGNNTTLSLFCPRDRDDATNQAAMVVYRDTPSLNNVINRNMEYKSSTVGKCYFGVALNDFDQKGYILLFIGDRGITDLTIGGGYYNGVDIIYEAFKNAEP